MSTINQSIQWNEQLLESMQDHEQVMFCQDPSTGLKAIIAIHNTALGPALGGCRMQPYKGMADALLDALRLSKGMTYKCAAADVDFGGGKAVLIGDPLKDKTPAMFRAFGRFVDSLNGRFYTGTDMGTNMEDFVHASRETSCITGIPEAYGGGGDSSIPTATGVIYGLQATNKARFGMEELEGRTYAIQGLGKVGMKVAEQLLAAGADLYVTDINEAAIEQVKEAARRYNGVVRPVGSKEIYAAEADVFVPCAGGGIINDDTIDVMKVKAIAGSANNQLLTDRHGEALKQKGILYAPDYMINCGGLIQVADELYGINKERVLTKTKTIYHSLLEVYEQAELDHVTTAEAANRLCEKRIEERKRLNHFFTRSTPPKWDVRI